MKKIYIFVALMTCAAAPVTELTPAHKKQIAASVTEGLKDPDSAQFRWLKPLNFGLYCGWINAKNSFGGYVGFKPFFVIGGVGDRPNSSGTFLVAGSRIGDDEGNEGIVNRMCSDHGFDMSTIPSSTKQK